MCTVTYLPLQEGFVLTSSRDEKYYRATYPPTTYQHYDQDLVYPKDQKAGGTWIASSDRNEVACLLNGAFENHTKKVSYSKSRGEIVLESFNYRTAKDFIDHVNVEGVEPFTLLLYKENKLSEIRWDESSLHYRAIDMSKAHIWSSATLYDAISRNQRASWFNNWIVNHKTNADFNIVAFHTKRHSDEIENDILMTRNNGTQTLSVTKLTILNDQIQFDYLDLYNNLVTNKTIRLKKYA